MDFNALLNLLEQMIHHVPVSPTDKEALFQQLDDLRSPDDKQARLDAQEQERQAAIQAQIDALQSQLSGSAKPANKRG